LGQYQITYEENPHLNYSNYAPRNFQSGVFTVEAL